MDNFLVKSFSEIDLADDFFGSLKIDYPEFTEWFNKKAAVGEVATVYLEDGKIKDFLYMKVEAEEMTNSGNCRIIPNLPKRNRLKVGTFKVESRGTRRGERLIKRALGFSIDKNVEEVYVTVFPKHEKLIELFVKYIIGKTNRDEIQNQMRLKFARKLQKRNVTEKSHTSYSQKWLSNVN